MLSDFCKKLKREKMLLKSKLICLCTGCSHRLTVFSRSGMTLRQYHVLQYAEYLHSDPALWRITVDYMCACREIGTHRADEVLLRVPLGFGAYSQPTGSDPDGKKSTSNGDDRTMETEDEASRIRAGDIVGVLKEVNQCCFEHGRESVRRMVCRVCIPE